jgi:hypothetical protein
LDNFFPTEKAIHQFWQKNSLGYILGHFFTKSSGHPGAFFAANWNGRTMDIFSNQPSRKTISSKDFFLHTYVPSPLCRSCFALGRCYNHNFLQFLAIFGEKYGLFSPINCLHAYIILLESKTPIFWLNFLKNS